MTYILFLPDERTLLMYDFNKGAGELLKDVQTGRWQPPAPYREPIAALAAEQPAHAPLRASLVGGFVIVTPSQPLVSSGERSPSPEPPEEAGQRSRLHPRKREILACLARGLSAADIARELGISRRAVQYHVAGLKTQLGASNRMDLLVEAAERGLCPRPRWQRKARRR